MSPELWPIAMRSSSTGDQSKHYRSSNVTHMKQTERLYSVGGERDKTQPTRISGIFPCFASSSYRSFFPFYLPQNTVRQPNLLSQAKLISSTHHALTGATAPGFKN